jgi:FrmR/RcnR family transcriptional regulator, repressor of frmRAB operon
VRRRAAAARLHPPGSLTGLTGEILADHLEEHVLDAGNEDASRQAVGEVTEVLKTYLR